MQKELEKYSDRITEGLENKSFIDPGYALSQGSWSLLARHGVGAVVGLGGIIILPVALGAQEWGCFATAFFLLAAMEMILANNGISAFIIQSSVSPTDEATANAFQASLGLLMFLVCCVATLFCFIAAGKESSPLLYLFPMVGLSALLSSFSTVPLALMAKKLHFGRVAFIESAGLISLYAVCIPLALSKTPVEVLSIGFVARAGVWAFLSYVCQKPRKLLAADKISLTRLLRTAGPIALSNAGAWFAEAVIPLIAGILLGTTALGVYRITYAILNYPRIIAYIFGRVLFSVLSAETDSQAKSSLSWKTFLGLTSLLTPLILTIAALAPLWVRVIFKNSEWQGLPVVFLLAGFHTAFYNICYIPIQALIAAKRSKVVVQFFALHSVILLFILLLSTKLLELNTVPVAGIIASGTSLIVLREFSRTYSKGSFLAIGQQLAIFLPASVITWYLAQSGKSLACLSLWTFSIVFWLIYSREGRNFTKIFILEFLLLKKSKLGMVPVDKEGLIKNGSMSDL